MHLREMVAWAVVAVFMGSVTQADQILLWNTLGSRQEIENSKIGPNGTVFGSGIQFVPGRFGNGFTSGTSSTGPDFGLWEQINPNYDERGTVEFWWKPDRDYDEGNSPPDTIFVSGVWSLPFPYPFQLLYRWREKPNGMGGFDFQVEGVDGRAHYLYTGKVAPFQAGQWVHVAFVWDTVDGLPNDPDKWYGVHVDGKYYPLVDSDFPEESINVKMKTPPGADFTMGYYTADFNNRLEGVLDNVKIWDVALVPEPATGALMLLIAGGLIGRLGRGRG